jgi:hypothetical protein
MGGMDESAFDFNRAGRDRRNLRLRTSQFEQLGKCRGFDELGQRRQLRVIGRQRFDRRQELGCRCQLIERVAWLQVRRGELAQRACHRHSRRPVDDNYRWQRTSERDHHRPERGRGLIELHH